MPKVLFFPLLQIPSGHHQVISSLSEQFNQSDLSIQYESVELLSSTNKQLELLISSVYLRWIKLFPSFYHYLYERSVYRSLEQEKRFIHYEWLFLNSMRNLIEQHQPDFIICSHALPSYLASTLKRSGECSATIINVYTDFFIHHIWGTDMVDAHLISLPPMREYLLNKGVKEEAIFQTGIPIHPEFENVLQKAERTKEYKVLVSGGSLGVGKIEDLLSYLPIHGKIHYYVLCGSNTKLYTKLIAQNHPRIIPFPYIKSKKKMNVIYHSVDAILSKPGGITISECLSKRLPIFVYDHLPGQEKINVDVLLNQDLIFYLPLDKFSQSFEEELLDKLNSRDFAKSHSKKMEQYHNGLDKITVVDLIKQFSS
ncbi:UDP-N-acetylglucosamine:LPS N-acetylglucosamine transferase [Bacillus mesophilus]|uniref:UDP-glucuronosyltransferase n=1 Tax=Bacillus mesophilus TaxID=1808955 RepID=A0A6M0QC35_9BACI|nr:UDP-glucuronosyltransferase [Bacillus mesophilus]MBM7663249.1 UDP-N-acetylglucosamine:LPS N-acetylglucosamine transferase [Bacillus mesophilus]NEY73913.1 UDP-glucuronosyltransferase [Bacillus mesophilus]